MRIQNKNMANTPMTLRFTSQDGDRVVVKGDEHGVFDVPEKEAKFLIGTPGWTPLREASELEEPAPPAKPDAPPSAPKPVGFKPAPPGPAKPAEKPAVAPEKPAEKPAVAEDLAVAALRAEVTGLRSKADALAFAELHEIEGLDAEMKLSEMKEKIEAELFEPVPEVSAEPKKGEEG